MENLTWELNETDYDWVSEFEDETVKRRNQNFIRWVQTALNKIQNARLSVDGVWGPRTRAAVILFQRKHGLKPDGIVGPITEHALITSGAPSLSGKGLATISTFPVRTLGTSIGGISGFIVKGKVLPSPKNLKVLNFNDQRVHRFPSRKRTGKVISEFIVHETVTRSVSDTVNVLRRRNLGVHFIMGPDGVITQHGDLANDRLGHAGHHNPFSVGIEVVNPYYPRYLRPGMPWTRVINARWAHGGRYVVPTHQQAEALAQLIGWITSPAAVGLSIPRNWIGLFNGKMAMNRVPGANHFRPGIYAHTYFGHADGAWLVLYAWLRIEKGLIPNVAYEEAIRLATTSKTFVVLPK